MLKTFRTLILLVAAIASTVHAEDLTLCRQGLGAAQSQQYERAISLYDGCVKSGDLTSSSLAKTYRNYANTYRAMAKPQMAIEFSNKAIALQPQDLWNDYTNRGNALSDLGKYSEALQDFNTAASLKPGLADIHYNRGIVFERMNERDKAKNEFLVAYQKGLRSQQLYERYVVYGLVKQGASAPSSGLASSNSLAADNELPSAKAIGAVWNLSLQPCNGGGANALHRHPNQKNIQVSKVVELPTLGARVRIPQLPGVEAVYIKLFLGDRTRGVIDNYVLFAEQDLSPPVGALVITELPQAINTTEKALASVAVLEGQLIWKAGLSSKLERIHGPYGDALELLIRNRVGTHCFPTSDFQLQSPSAEGGTIGISRFTYALGKLIEFSLIVRLPVNMDEEAAAVYSRKVMDGFWLSLQPL